MRGYSKACLKTSTNALRKISGCSTLIVAPRRTLVNKALQLTGLSVAALPWPPQLNAGTLGDKMTRWLLTLSVVMVVGCSSECDLAAALKARSGGGATDCGDAVLGTDASPVDACVVAAFEKGTAFVAQYDRMGKDSRVVFGVAGDASGRVTFLLWDGDPSGGSGADPVISGNLCVGPAADSSSMRDPFLSPPLTCRSTTSLGRTCG